MTSKKVQFTFLTLVSSLTVVTLMIATSGNGNATSAEHARTRASSSAPIWSEMPPPEARKDGRVVYPVLSDGRMALPSFADIVEEANPAVVNITATKIIDSKERSGTGRNRLDFFFPRPDRERRDNDTRERDDSGGSGFIISEDGFILTNHHVIEDADRINVRLLGDSREYKAELIGSDPDTDVALLRIDSSRPLPFIPLGDSGVLRVGDWVMAIGNPLAYEHTVTVGVVSAKGRKLWAMDRDPSLDNFIQTDAAINRGNSGGPLLNARGEAIGINSAISVAGQGISFAIPVNMAKQVAAQLADQGKVSRGALGVRIRDVARELDPDKREYFGLQGRHGAFVESVTPGLPAAEAGLRRGDAIISVDGQELKSSDDLIRKISSKTPGEEVTIGIVRDGREQSIQTALADRDALDTGIRRPARRATKEEEPEEEESFDLRLGVMVHEISPAMRREYRIDDKTEGVVIVHVGQTSQAWDKGLRKGDVIIEINRNSIGDLKQYRSTLKKLDSGELANLYVVNPGGQARFVTLRVIEEE
jgi:serine protease Do